jgi:protein-arginine kinase activator protein McsA
MKENKIDGQKYQPQTKAAPVPNPIICCQHCSQKADLFVSCVNAHGKVTSKAFCLPHAIKEGLLHPRKWELIPGETPLHHCGETSCACGMTEGLLRVKGRAGCAKCYKTFEEQFKLATSNVQPGIVHIGKTPVRMAPVANVRRRIRVLEMVMERAIKKEAYERAAVCRDRIKELSQTKA